MSKSFSQEAPIDEKLPEASSSSTSVARSTTPLRSYSIDSRDPRQWSKWNKWRVIACASALNFLDTICSSAAATSIPAILEDFGIDKGNRAAVSLVVSIYVLGIAVGPLVLAPLSEVYGRQWLYLGSNFLFVAFNTGCGFSKNLGMLIGFRVLTGVVSATPATIGAGTIADLMGVEERTYPTALWASCAIIGPILGPIVGGFITAGAGWRWVFWTMAMAGATILVPCIFFLRETHDPTIMRRKTKALKEGHSRDVNRSGQSPLSLAIVLIRPLRMLFTDWTIFLCSIYSALADAYLFIVLTTFAEIFITVYGFSTAVSGLASLGMGLGAVFGHLLHTMLSNRTVHFHQSHGDYRPEHRLLWMPIGSFAMPLGLFWYGWCVEKRVHWIVSIIGMFPCGMGFTILMVPLLGYLVDAYTQYAASAVASLVVTRAVAGAFLPLVAFPLYDNLGQGWGNSLLAFIGLAFAPLPILMYLYGEKLRLRGPNRTSR